MHNQKKPGRSRKQRFPDFAAHFTVLFLSFYFTFVIAKENIEIIILYTPTHFLYVI
jgi:hypothetical protein